MVSKMATKMKPVDNSVNERRLRPIYDWLDNGNNKKALQEAEKVLKKQPNLQCARVLKALAMVRLGKSEEAQTILQEVQLEEPCEDATLQAMAICYRETHRPELTCQIYEAAVRKDPLNEEFLSHLFMGYVRIGDYRKQQLTAMALFKVKPKNPYYFWAVMSILMQAYVNDDTVCLTITLPLAERMIKKFVEEKKIEAEAEVQLYLMVLEKQKKYQEALQVLQGSLSEKLANGMIENKKGEYLRQMKRWDQMLDYTEELLRSNPDQWSYYSLYMEALFELTSTTNADVIGRAKTFLLSLMEQERLKSENKLRGPYLAMLFFWQQLQQRNFDASTVFGNFREFAQEYVEVMGDKPCAFQDLRPFVSSLPAEQVNEFLGCVTQSVGLDQSSSQSPTTVKQICRHLLHIQLNRFLGQHDLLNKEEKIELSQKLWGHYLQTKSLNAGLLATDFRPNDGYALLAAHLLLDTWNNDPVVLDKCLLLLETALANSPANYHLKLLVTRVYTLAGHGRAAFQRYESLDVKYIQLDSLGHLLCRPLISMGLPYTASPLLSNTLRFYTTHARETSECLISAYKFGSFGKIPEFTQFCQRLDSSAHFASSTTERMLLDLLLDGNSHTKLVQSAAGMFADPDKDQPDWKTCVDNRDCGVFVSWDPPAKNSREDMVKTTFKDEVKFAQLRNRLVHSLIATVSLSPSWQSQVPETKNRTDNSVNGQTVEEPTNQIVLQRLLSEIRHLLTELKSETFMSHNQFSVQSPPPPRLYTYVENGALEPLLILMDVVAKGQYVIGSDDILGFERALSQVIESAQLCVPSEGFWRNYIRLERVYNAVETLCLCVLIVSTMHAIIKTSNALIKKKKKKGEAKNDDANSGVEQFSTLVRCMTSSIGKMEVLFEELNVQVFFSQMKLTDSEIAQGAEAITAEIQKKLSQSPVSEMKSLLADKLKLLETCKL
ncbi:N-alpha-acetyltransferase 25, NatB auxiliary subunit-like [Daphnia pulex]|uniref:N-alpha-acetyltransferase 25, NatB auxiliary subunit-like n=1 Tax=Daphnia pulex TaxID=6669 RepID=UPI001EDFF031|nr:N-alpha-acetyltransferase 25, NatB auxiliary subunit-like [Daphnia pulex]